MRLCFILPGPMENVYTPNFLLGWTDLIMKCAQRGHQVMVSQQKTRSECFLSTGTEVFDAYMCIDSDMVFDSEDVFKLIESPHDFTGAVITSSDGVSTTFGKTYDQVSKDDQYIEVDELEPTFVLMRRVPDGWNFESKIKAHVDTSVRVGHRITLVV
jgi:hypothetical protein